ncbi:hypothetical protein [Blastococcus sp. TF02A-30]|uniref:hypothetical protein n=1 Tax=Blastococcus sp. TF02A-30 TaxID=2250580 RepID=UPI000DEBDB4E|nr:hypothetical protein [Blastococcus sp. TF02A-30]RBY92931.1 hypothetical protein DQ241_02535 [Blastococcus sp. TF02A-30]
MAPAPQREDDARRGDDGSWRVLLGAIAAVGVLSVAVLVAVWDAGSGTLGFELGKALMQLVLVVLAGALVKFLADEHARKRTAADQRAAAREAVEQQRAAEREALVQQRRESLRGVLARATDAYQAVKRARRLLRAGLIHDPDGAVRVGEVVYDEQLALVSDAQLEFELLQVELDTEGAIASGQGGLGLPEAQARKVAAGLRVLRTYLSDLVTEYETHRPTFRDGASPLARLPRLSDFLDRGRTGFTGEAAGAFRDVRRLIRAEMLSAPALAHPDGDSTAG